MTGALGIIREQDVAVPMRDGVVLRANVFRPAGTEAVPGLLLRTPYGKPTGGFQRYVRAGYAVVAQDSRGRYASAGEFVPFSAPDTGDAEDGYDSVEWLAAQSWCNGRVGTMGVSYNAWMQWELARLQPPHLEAMAAASIPLEMTDVDWCGAFKPARRVKWWMTTLAPDLRRRAGLPPPHTPAEARQLWDDVEQGSWLGLLPWREFPRHLPPPLDEYAARWLANPRIRPWGFARIHARVLVPNLDFSGWYDHCGGTMQHLALMQQHGGSELAREQTRLVIGPWSHAGLGRRQMGDVDFGEQAELNREDLIVRWFDRWLKDVPNSMEAEPAVRYFVMGKGRWESSDTWPPQDTREYLLHVHSVGPVGMRAAGGVLRNTPPTTGGCERYTYDPRNPVPTLWTRALFTVPADRRQLDYRDDILCYRSAPLEREVVVVGYPQVVLFAASSARDTDFFARLVDESPDGMALEVCYGMVRARHRHGLDREQLLTPGMVTRLHIRLSATAIAFMPGHRIRLEITSSDFPNHDRNHNTGGDDLQEVHMLAAEQSVYHGPEHPTRLVLPVRS